MGKKKIKLGRTKKRAKHSLIVSIARKNVSVHVSSLAITRSQLEATVDPSPSTCTVWTVADQFVLLMFNGLHVLSVCPLRFLLLLNLKYVRACQPVN